MIEGRIIRGVGGFYYVAEQERILECKARGGFRNQGIKPLVGDRVRVELTSDGDSTGNIIELLPRVNTMLRPAVANVDQAVVIFALSHPKPNRNLLDRFLLMMQTQSIDTIICFNKADDIQESVIRQITDGYKGSRVDALVTSAKTGEGIGRLKRSLIGKTTVMAGPSGVGKSSIMNRIYPKAGMETGAISQKIKRGKHTTRHTELFCIGEDTFIMDTPGFTSLRLPDMDKEELKDYYPEFSVYAGECRFHGCVHIHEPGCRVREALMAGEIDAGRYENYLQFYEELQQSKKY